MNATQLQARIDAHVQVVQRLAERVDRLEAIADLLIQTFRAGHKVWLAGNGGSAADAQHVAAELVVRLHVDRVALPAVALSAGGAVGTAIGNDLSYEQVFSRQLEGLLQPGDVFWAFSTSGRSRNILAAAMVAKARGGKVIAFTGPSENPLSQLADLALHAAGDKTDLIQEVHQVAYHFICQQVEAAFAPRSPQAEGTRPPPG